MTLAFVGGGCTMALEMAMARQLAPWFGASMPVWAALIAWVLLLLAGGAWLGGRFSLRGGTTRDVGLALVGVAGSLGAAAFVGPTLLQTCSEAMFGHGMTELELVEVPHPAVGALAGLAALVGSAVPLVLLGGIVPVLVRASVHDADEAGMVAGRIHAAATLGSLGGTLLPAFLAIPLLGVRWTLLVLAGLCLTASALAWRRDVPAVAIAGLVTAGAALPAPHGDALVTVETLYHQARVHQRVDGQRELRIDAGWSTQSIRAAEGPARSGSWPLFLVAQALRPGCATAPKRALVLGLGGGTMARDLSLAFPGVEVTGVELDLELVELGRRYLDLPAKTRVVIEDARRFAHHDTGRYDLIFVDTFRDVYIPPHLTTREFFADLARRLAPGGVLAINLFAWNGDDRIARALGATVQTALPRVRWLQQPRAANRVLFADLAEPRGAGVCAAPATSAQRSIVGRFLPRVQPLPAAEPNTPIFTDDRAPIEHLTHLMIVGGLLGGPEAP